MIENEILEKVKNSIFKKQEPVLKTGFNDLDNILMELEKSSIITVGGRPSMGKTSFLINIMLNLLEQKKKCLYLSNEDSYAYYVLRKFIPILTNIEVVRIKYQMEEINKQERDEIIRALAKIGQLDLTILGTDEGSFSIEKIKEKIEEIKPDYVFIDSLQLIKIPNSEPAFVKSDFVKGLNDFMYEIKKVAKENNCMIFIASQLSRALERRQSKMPLLSDIRDCSAAEDISDVVLFIYREEYYHFYDEKDYLLNRGKANIIIAKNKYGEVGTINLLFNNRTLKFSNPVCSDVF